MIIDKSVTCCFSGHRTLKNDFDKNLLKSEIIKQIEKGYKNFLIGMAVGFDTQCFLTIKELQRDFEEYKSLKIIACVPCETQSSTFSKSDKELYDKMLKVADEKILISQNYFAGCMQKRNRFMVDNSSLLICYKRKNSGGTYSTYNYAKKCGINIIEV